MSKVSSFKIVKTPNKNKMWCLIKINKTRFLLILQMLHRSPGWIRIPNRIKFKSIKT